MLIAIRRLGNSRGILIPKPLLKQAGLEDQAEILVEGNTLIVRRPKPAPRQDGLRQARSSRRLVMTSWSGPSSQMKPMRIWNGRS